MYQFDFLGWQTEDLVTSLGSSSSSSSSSSSGAPSGVDGAVQRIARTYELRGLQNVTSYSSPVIGIGQGNVVNDIERVYNSFEQVVMRYLHPLLGTWLTRDPAPFVADLSLDDYAGGSPVSATDPLGLMSRWLSFILGLIPVANILAAIFQDIPGSSVNDYAGRAPSANRRAGAA